MVRIFMEDGVIEEHIAASTSHHTESTAWLYMKPFLPCRCAFGHPLTVSPTAQASAPHLVAPSPVSWLPGLVFLVPYLGLISEKPASENVNTYKYPCLPSPNLPVFNVNQGA